MKVSIYKDRVEIYNPGAFPDGFEPQDFIDKSERPIRRNPKIARILYYSKDIKADKNAGQNERYEMIIKYIQERGFITNKEAREILGLADSTVKRILKGMVDKEILTIEGERKARRYLLK